MWIIRPVVPGGSTGGAMAHPNFGRSVARYKGSENPVRNRLKIQLVKIGFSRWIVQQHQSYFLVVHTTYILFSVFFCQKIIWQKVKIREKIWKCANAVVKSIEKRKLFTYRHDWKQNCVKIQWYVSKNDSDKNCCYDNKILSK